MYVPYPLSLRNVEDLLDERGIDISHETVRFWWNWFGPMFAAEICKRRVAHMRGYPQWRWHLDEVFVKVNGRLCDLGARSIMKAKSWRLVVTAKRDKAAALRFLSGSCRNTGLLAASSPIGFGVGFGGLTIALDALATTYLKIAHEQGIDPGLLHRVAVIGAGTLDSLPHNGAVVTLLAVCNSTHRESYMDIVMVSIVGGLLALAAVIALGSGRVVLSLPSPSGRRWREASDERARFGPHPKPSPRERGGQAVAAVPR